MLNEWVFDARLIKQVTRFFILFHTDTTLIDRPIDPLASPLKTLLPLVRSQFVVRLSSVCLSFVSRLSLVCPLFSSEYAHVRGGFSDYRAFWYMPLLIIGSFPFLLYNYSSLDTSSSIYLNTITFFYVLIPIYIYTFLHRCIYTCPSNNTPKYLYTFTNFYGRIRPIQVYILLRPSTCICLRSPTYINFL